MGRWGRCQAYDLGAVDIKLRVVRTNLAPRTIVRAPGFLNSVMVSEHIVDHIAAYLKADPAQVRAINFLKSAPTVTAVPWNRLRGTLQHDIAKGSFLIVQESEWDAFYDTLHRFPWGHVWRDDKGENVLENPGKL